MNTQSAIKRGLSIGILGGNGFLGSDLVRMLNINHKVDAITRGNYEKKKGTYYGVFINANGNSKRFWANQNPLDDFFVSTTSVYKSIFDFSCNLYVYISSPDIYENHTEPRYSKENQEINPQDLPPYGFNKYLAELLVKKYKKNFLILRSSMILGTKLKKGPFYDILNNKALFITLQSRLQLITTRALAEIIEVLLKKSVTMETINIGGKGSFDFTNIRKYFKKEIQILTNAETQMYEMNVEKLRHWYPELKTSEEYLQEFLQDYEKKRL